jgi:hypothetical protein
MCKVSGSHPTRSRRSEDGAWDISHDRPGVCRSCPGLHPGSREFPGVLSGRAGQPDDRVQFGQINGFD